VVAGDSQDLNSASLRQQIEYLREHDCGCAWNDQGILSSHFPEGFDEVIVRMAIEILLRDYLYREGKRSGAQFCATTSAAPLSPRATALSQSDFHQ
jgi:hypothetical protein